MFSGNFFNSLVRTPRHSGFCFGSVRRSARSPRAMIVQGHTAAILRVGPASPSTASLTSRSRIAVCDGERADSSVWGSSIKAKSGRSTVPSGRVCRSPRMLASSPAATITDPAAGEPGIHGATTRRLPHSIRVNWPR